MTDSVVNKITDNIDQLLELLPLRVSRHLKKERNSEGLSEVVLDLGRSPEFRYTSNKAVYLDKDVVTQEDIDHVVNMVGSFNTDNRAGIERTLHRISCMRNRMGKIIGLTCRVGRAVYGTIDVISDIISSGKNILVMGGPGVGKTTKLREMARVLASDYHKRVVIVDTSNEIAGDGDIPHPAIGLARRMQVSSPDRQHDVMIEAVENHMPQIIVVDEIGTEAESAAARTIAERGVQLIGTAHGTTIENLIKNPTLSDLVGGVQAVILGDDEAKRRNSQKTILERKAPPTFQVLVEIHDYNTVGIYHDTALTVDAILRSKKPKPEIRTIERDGSIRMVQNEATQLYDVQLDEEAEEKLDKDLLDKRVAIYAFGINRTRLLRALKVLNINARVVMNLEEADIVVTTKTHNKPNSNFIRSIQGKKLPLHVIRSDTTAQINKFLSYAFKLYDTDQDAINVALREVEEVIKYVENNGKVAEVSPAGTYVRRLQKHYCTEKGLRCESIGEEPNRRVRIYPKI